MAVKLEKWPISLKMADELEKWPVSPKLAHGIPKTESIWKKFEKEKCEYDIFIIIFISSS